MQDFPHHYLVSGQASQAGDVIVSCDNSPDIVTAPPPQFGGPGDKWSPEDLLAAAVADCFILSFRAIAKASRLEWQSLKCDVDAVLDRVDGVTQFTELHITAYLQINEPADHDKANRLLEKAERSCLITNSMTARAFLTVRIQ